MCSGGAWWLGGDYGEVVVMFVLAVPVKVSLLEIATDDDEDSGL